MSHRWSEDHEPHGPFSLGRRRCERCGLVQDLVQERVRGTREPMSAKSWFPKQDECPANTLARRCFALIRRHNLKSNATIPILRSMNLATLETLHEDLLACIGPPEGGNVATRTPIDANPEGA